MINNREWESLEDLAFHMRLGRPLSDYKTNPQHVKAARMLESMGYVVRGGDSIDFIKATNKGGVMPLPNADEELINIDAYLDALTSTFAQIAEPMDINLNFVRTSEGELKREYKLSDFMV